ncbi:MAG TPA: zf-HC2 domain-containing protein [Gemmatimonadales bacterium]|nr:zf-HC2 domain-containing protein [Gemmatimonadales bacterium]
MRHIPADELHAYLDQALSRSQCVEIEHHLASCPACRAERDGIAALRDRTTAILVAAAPRKIRPRPFTHLSATVAEQRSRRNRALRSAAWAASVVGALGLGWALHQWSAGAEPSGSQAAASGQPLLAPALLAATPSRPDQPAAAPRREQPPVLTAGTTPAPARGETPEAAEPHFEPDTPAPRLVALPAAGPADTVGFGGARAAQQPVLPGVWRTVAWDKTQAEREQWVPRVEGVPVVGVKMREAPQGGRPLTVVMQQLANGEMISTVEGPATEVAALLSQQPGQSASAELQDMQATAPAPGSTDGRPGTAPGSVPRTLAIFGSAPSDSLKALMLRVR